MRRGLVWAVAVIGILLLQEARAEDTATAGNLKLAAKVLNQPLIQGKDAIIDVELSTEGDTAYTFLLAAFPQDFGIYILGPWGIVQPDPKKIRPENWMH